MKICEIDSSKDPFIFGVSTSHCHKDNHFNIQRSNLQWKLPGSEMDSKRHIVMHYQDIMVDNMRVFAIILLNGGEIKII